MLDTLAHCRAWLGTDESRGAGHIRGTILPTRFVRGREAFLTYGLTSAEHGSFLKRGFRGENFFAQKSSPPGKRYFRKIPLFCRCSYGSRRSMSRGNGIVSLTWCIPAIHARVRSIPKPNPA